VNYKQQTGNGTSTQLVQISNKLKGGYRFGYNGQEKVDEIAGAGNHTTAEFWEYDTRLGRRWNRDPVVKPYESGYACFANNPIWFSDVNGDDGTPSGGEPMMSCSSSGVVVKSSKLNPDKKDDEEDEDEDGKKSSGGGGGGGAGGAGGGPNNKNSVGGDQLRKHARQLAASGIGMESNGGGSDKSAAFLLTAGQTAFNEIAVPIMLAEPTPFGEAIVGIVNGAFLIYNMSNIVDENQSALSKINPKKQAREEAKKKREEQPASENYAKHKAKQKEKAEGKDARRESHDKKEKGGPPNRTKKQLDDDYKINNQL
jgi:hypothetical protein